VLSSIILSIQESKHIMKTDTRLTIGIAFAMLTHAALCAAEPAAEIAGLQQTASDFVAAYNNRDAAAVTVLFAENGEITDLSGENTTSGRAAIKARYEELFADKEAPQLAVEVESVRLVTPAVAIEDGTYHLDLPGDDEPVRSITYTAVLVKDTAGKWEIASTRSLKDVTDAAGQLAGFAAALKGDWTCQKDDVRMDFAFGWDDTGKFLAGEMLLTKPDIDPQTTSIRIGWDGARKTITWWTFDSEGGFAKGDWTPSDAGWLLRTEGTTADGESTSGNGILTRDGKDTLIWKATNRLVDGEKLPDNELHLARRAPEPDAEGEPAAE
jgi:uncharacterized protein (TIGR02246 family)